MNDSYTSYYEMRAERLFKYVARGVERGMQEQRTASMDSMRLPAMPGCPKFAD
jgi:hypothetical protein